MLENKGVGKGAANVLSEFLVSTNRTGERPVQISTAER